MTRDRILSAAIHVALDLARVNQRGNLAEADEASRLRADLRALEDALDEAFPSQPVTTQWRDDAPSIVLSSQKEKK